MVMPNRTELAIAGDRSAPQTRPHESGIRLPARRGRRNRGANGHPDGDGPAPGGVPGRREFRRYLIKPGERQNFADYFESFFPEFFEQLGAIAFGQFLERDNPSRFTWLRGFHTIEDRAAVNGAFYDGPLWKEHRKTMNDILVDSDNVLLLHPIGPNRGIAVLPAVDPVREMRLDRGIVVAQIFAVEAGAVDAFARRAESEFAAYRAAGARETGVLATARRSQQLSAAPRAKRRTVSRVARHPARRPGARERFPSARGTVGAGALGHEDAQGRTGARRPRTDAAIAPAMAALRTSVP